jgi:hypothetical protein
VVSESVLRSVLCRTAQEVSRSSPRPITREPNCTYLWLRPNLVYLFVLFDPLKHIPILLSFPISTLCRSQFAERCPCLACHGHKLARVLSSVLYQSLWSCSESHSRALVTSQIRHSSMPTSSVTSYCAPQAVHIIRSSVVLNIGMATSIFLLLACGEVSEPADPMALKRINIRTVV